MLEKEFKDDPDKLVCIFKKNITIILAPGANSLTVSKCPMSIS